MDTYDQLYYIEKMSKGDLATAIWKDGPLYYDTNTAKWIRKSNEKVVLKYISQNAIDELLNKV